MENAKNSPSRLPLMTDCAMRIYPGGTITDMGHLIATETSAKRARRKVRRSTIKTFSKASSARLRRLLIQARGPDGWACFGATLTIPGPPISPEEWHRIWNAFRHKILRYGKIVLIWRIELQQRGQPHVHCVCWGKTGQGRIREYWDDALGLLGPTEGPVQIGYDGRNSSGEDYCEYKAGWAIATTRRLWPKACEHAVRIDGLGVKDMGWWRYTVAHASKSKQAQLGWKGRQWGVVNRALLALATPTVITLKRKAMYKARRCLQRLTGCRYASGHGLQSWLATPAPVVRACDWAKSEVGG